MSVTREDAESMMKDMVLTRQAVAARVAELFDPAGLYEPIKLQLKLLLAELNGKDWKTPLTPKEQDFWKRKLLDFIDFHRIRVPRCVVPLKVETRTSDWSAFWMQQLKLVERLSMQV